ncbi:hypothetical protein [Acidithiobacillus albertensis]|uniref:hypothetical protein n=1 Tax=Acidithiobacillus albertensis TaxID=119978 RepID=UPI00094B37ED|nr:hypothetical protein [Acidithiobacillus albertensis]
MIIARRNKAIAELRPISATIPAKKSRPMGLAKGKIHWAEDAFAPLSDAELADWYDTHRNDPLQLGTTPDKT